MEQCGVGFGCPREADVAQQHAFRTAGRSGRVRQACRRVAVDRSRAGRSDRQRIRQQHRSITPSAPDHRQQSGIDRDHCRVCVVQQHVELVGRQACRQGHDDEARSQTGKKCDDPRRAVLGEDDSTVARRQRRVGRTPPTGPDCSSRFGVRVAGTRSVGRERPVEGWCSPSATGSRSASAAESLPGITSTVCRRMSWGSPARPTNSRSRRRPGCG